MDSIKGKLPDKYPLLLNPRSEPYKIYEKLLTDGSFKDKHVYGVSEKEHGFVTCDWVESPGSLYCGGMGSGKSIAMRFSLITQLLANSENTALFIIDPLQGATDYSILGRKETNMSSNVVIVKDDNNKIVQVIESLYEEFIKRKNEFNENNYKNIYYYEKATNKKLARIVIAIENFHAILNLDCVKFHMKVDNIDSVAYKLKTLMRMGRSYGLFFMLAAQRATSEDIPSSLRPALSMLMSFYSRNPIDHSAINLVHAQDIKMEERGRCAYENGFMRFPYLDDESAVLLIQKHFKPLKANLLNIQMNEYHNIINNKDGDVYPYSSILKINPLQSQPTPKKVEDIIKTILKIPVTNDLKNKLYDFYNEVSKKDLTPGQIVSYFLRSSKFFFKTEPEIKDLEVLILKPNECEPTQEKMDQIISYVSLIINKKLSPTEIDCGSMIILNAFRTSKTINWATIFEDIKKIVSTNESGRGTDEDTKLNDFLLNVTMNLNNSLNNGSGSFVINEQIYNQIVDLKGVEQFKALLKSFKDKDYNLERNSNNELIISKNNNRPSFNDFVVSVLEADTN